MDHWLLWCLDTHWYTWMTTNIRFAVEITCVHHCFYVLVLYCVCVLLYSTVHSYNQSQGVEKKVQVWEWVTVSNQENIIYISLLLIQVSTFIIKYLFYRPALFSLFKLPLQIIYHIFAAQHYQQQNQIDKEILKTHTLYRLQRKLNSV